MVPAIYEQLTLQAMMDSKEEYSYCPPSLQKTNRYTLALVLLLLAGIAGIYYYYITIMPVLRPSDFHGMLAESFLKGHTYLLHYYPSRELLSFPDPYNSEVTRDYALWDASLYKSHYYLYFGPVPALLIAPIQYFTDTYVSDPILVWAFSFAGTAFLVLLLASIATQQKFTSRLALVFCITAISLGTWIPFMLRRPSFYEVAVAGAYCFSALGFLLLWRALHSKHMHCLMVAGSLCLGLAVGCRYLHVFNLFVLGFAWLITWRKQPIRKLFALFLPWGLCMLCLMAYNYARFEDVFESGLHYQITVFNVHSPDYHPLQLKKFFHNIYYYFLRPLDWREDHQFPYISVTYYNMTPLFGGIVAESMEPIYGLFSNSPFSLFMFAVLFSFWHKPTRFAPETLVILAGIVLYCSGIIGYLMFFIFSTVRYAVDFSPWLMLIASLQYLRLLAMANSKTMRFALFAIGGSAAAYGALTNLLSGYCGQYLCAGM